jgi:hypothetical protein
MRPTGKVRVARILAYDFTTPCPLCGYGIPPIELIRTGRNTMICPACRQEFFVPEIEGYSTS